MLLSDVLVVEKQLSFMFTLLTTLSTDIPTGLFAVRCGIVCDKCSLRCVSVHGKHRKSYEIWLLVESHL